jgi:hypothetical protein
MDAMNNPGRARFVLTSSQEPPEDVNDWYMRAIEDPQLPQFVVSGWLSDECCEMFRTIVAEGLLGTCEIMPPFDRFTIIVESPVAHKTNDGATLFEHGALVSIEPENWIIRGRVDADAEDLRTNLGLSANAAEVSWYVATRFNPHTKAMAMVNLPDLEGREFFKTLGENWMATILGLCVLLRHPDVEIFSERVPKQMRDRGVVESKTYRIVLPPDATVVELGREVAREHARSDAGASWFDRLFRRK